jgi:hypothetical protein
MNELQELKINPRFQAAIPPLTVEEYDSLRESISSEGCRDSLIVWNGYIVDGHNRFAICRELGVPFSTREAAFENEEAVIEWIMFNQLSRRNLSDAERVRIAGKLKACLAAKAKINQGTRTDILTDLHNPITPMNTRREIAKIACVSEGTVAKVEKVDREAPLLIREAMGKTISIDRAAHLNAILQKLPEDKRNAEAKLMFSAEYTEKMERLNREGRIMKKLHNIIACASMDYEYIAADCVDVYIRRTPLSMESILGTIDDQIEWLKKLERLFVERDAIVKERRYALLP